MQPESPWLPKHEAISRVTVRMSSQSASLISITVDTTLEVHGWSHSAQVGGAPAPLRLVRSRYRHLFMQSIGSVHSMWPWLRPLPL